MTTAEQAEYLKAKGWTQKGELWQRAKNGYLWEISAAVKHQRWRDYHGERPDKFADEEANGKDGGIPRGKRLDQGDVSPDTA